MSLFRIQAGHIQETKERELRTTLKQNRTSGKRFEKSEEMVELTQNRTSLACRILLLELRLGLRYPWGSFLGPAQMLAAPDAHPESEG